MSIPHFPDNFQKSQSITVRVGFNMFEAVENILQKDLNLVKNDFQHGTIYKTQNRGVTVTAYKSTDVLNVHVSNIYTWLDSSLYFSEKLDFNNSKEVSPSTSIPLKNSNSLLSQAYLINR